MACDSVLLSARSSETFCLRATGLVSAGADAMLDAGPKTSSSSASLARGEGAVVGKGGRSRVGGGGEKILRAALAAVRVRMRILGESARAAAALTSSGAKETLFLLTVEFD